jgi:prevent-host-death family protein
MEKFSAFEAKTRLSELLREAERGMSFVICRRGKEVARLVPLAAEEKTKNIKETLSSFREIRGRISGKINIQELIEEGRRF